MKWLQSIGVVDLCIEVSFMRAMMKSRAHSRSRVFRCTQQPIRVLPRGATPFKRSRDDCLDRLAVVDFQTFMAGDFQAS